MKNKELQRVKSSLLRELDETLQKCYHQGIQEVMTDLRIRHSNVRPDSSPDEIFSLFLQSGILKTKSTAPVIQMRESLERLRKGSFGFCSLCGREISVEYLEKNPTTTHCVSCDRESKKLLQKPNW